MKKIHILPFVHRHKTLVTNIARPDFRSLPLRMEPQRTTNYSSEVVCSLLYDTLVKTSSDGTLILRQAASFSISPDRKTYVFHLRKNRWSDGTPVTAFDFEQTWKHFLSPHVECPNIYFFFVIRNASKAKQGLASPNEVGIKALDPQTLSIELEKPISFLLELLSCYVFAPLHPSSIAGFFPHSTSTYYPLISNGPFKLRHWSPNVELVMDKNPYFHRANAIYFERVRVNYLVSDMRVIDHFLQGNVDIVLKHYCLVFKHPTIKYLVNTKELFSEQLAGTCCCVFNTSHRLLKHKKLRKALNLGIDRPKILHRLTMLGEQPADGLLPPVFLKQHSIPSFSKFQLLEARALFQEACREAKISQRQLSNHFTLLFPHSEFYYNLAEELRECWEFIFDIKVSTRPATLEDMMQEMHAGKFCMALLTWHAYYHHPLSLLTRFRTKSNPKNYCHWNTKEFIELLDLATYATTKEESWEYCRQANEILKDEVPIAPIFYGRYGSLIQPYIKNFGVSPLGAINFDDITFDWQTLQTRPFPEHQYAKELIRMLKQSISEPIRQIHWYGVKFPASKAL
jgi:oligopeptide transport system substrate-binding protein